MSEYACHNGLPKYLSEDLENIQCRALRIIFPALGYQEALKECNIATLYQRRQLMTERLFSEIKDNTCHKLHGLLPSSNLSTVALRRNRAFNVPFCRTNKLKNSFIMYNAAISLWLYHVWCGYFLNFITYDIYNNIYQEYFCSSVHEF